MTIIAKEFAAKLSVAVVAIAMVFSAFASTASAQTAEELQQMINDLLAQIAQLEGATGVDAGTGACVSIPAPLTIGSQGADVTALQNVLIGNGYSIPAGATGYFGGQTQAALAAWQADNGISPAVGYYGPISKAALDASCSADDMMDDDMDDDDMDDDDMMDDDDDMMSGDLSGEGVLSMFEVDEEESEVSEGDEDEVVADFQVEAEDGDILLTRITIALADATLGTANEENDPWDVFDEFSVWVDGDKVGSFEADDEDEYTDEDDNVYSFRFTDLDLVIMEDEETEILFAVSVANSVDGSDTTDAADWVFDVASVRYFDADDVATTEDNFDDLDGRDDTDLRTSDTAGQFEFDIEEAGTDDDAQIESSSDDPDAATLKVDDDNSDSEDYTVFVFDIDVDDESSDLLVGDVDVDVVISNASTTQSYDVDDVIADIMLTIDGTTEEGDEVSQSAVTAGVSTTTFEFEFDDDVELEADEEYEVTVEISFVGTDDGANYAPGTTIQVFVDGQEWEVEGVEDDNVLEGTEQSEIHTLNTVIPIISNISVTESTNDAQTTGSVSFRFTVEADGEDDIEGFDAADIISTVTGGADTATGTLSRTGGDTPVSCGAGCFDIRDGDEVDFAFTFTFDDNANGIYFVNVDRILGVEIDETSDALDITGN